jgi:hypothetical protein
VLAEAGSGLEGAGFLVETEREPVRRFIVPIPVGLNGRRQEESFKAYTYYESKGFVEVDAERAVTNT